MDQYLKLITDWFKELDIGNIDLEKLKKQLSIISDWFKNNTIGVVEAVTGFGKSMILIITIYRLNLKYPDAKTIIVVPWTNLYLDWLDHIETFGLKNVTVHVINGYCQKYLDTKIQYNCGLLAVDEVHNILSENGVLFNQTLKATKFQMFMGLSATINDEEKGILVSSNIPIVATVTMGEAKARGYVSDYVVYNLGITLTLYEQAIYDRYNDIHNSNLANFRYFAESEKNWELIRACTAANDKKAKVGNDWRTGKQWRQWYAETMGWIPAIGDEDKWSPKSIGKSAHQWNWAMTQRKEFLYKHPQKLEVTKQIIDKFNLPTITFGQSIESVDKLTKMLGSKARSYHSGLLTSIVPQEVSESRTVFKSAKLLKNRTQGVMTVDNSTPGKPIYTVTYNKNVKISKEKQLKIIKEEFEDGKCSVLNTAKSLNEGYNVVGILMAILYAITSTKRGFVQRLGRSIRYVEGKRAIIVVVYIMNTQDEAWVKKAQKDQSNVYYINKIEEII